MKIIEARKLEIKLQAKRLKILKKLENSRDRRYMILTRQIENNRMRFQTERRLKWNAYMRNYFKLNENGKKATFYIMLSTHIKQHGKNRGIIKFLTKKLIDAMNK